MTIWEFFIESQAELLPSWTVQFSTSETDDGAHPKEYAFDGATPVEAINKAKKKWAQLKREHRT